jgi:hypothetical protein
MRAALSDSSRSGFSSAPTPPSATTRSRSPLLSVSSLYADMLSGTVRSPVSSFPFRMVMAAWLTPGMTEEDTSQGRPASREMAVTSAALPRL